MTIVKWSIQHVARKWLKMLLNKEKKDDIPFGREEKFDHINGPHIADVLNLLLTTLLTCLGPLCFQLQTSYCHKMITSGFGRPLAQLQPD